MVASERRRPSIDSIHEEDLRTPSSTRSATRRWSASIAITKGVVEGDRARQARDLQSRQLDQGPDGGQDDRGRRAGGAAEAGRHDHRRHVRQHRHGARDRGGRQGVQVRLHDHRQAVEGEGRRAEGVWRRGDRLPDQRRSGGSALVLLGVVAARDGDSQRLEGQPVRQPVEFSGALRADRTGDLGADRRPRHAPGRRRRDRRHHFGRRHATSRSATRRSRCGASTPTARCSRNTRRPASSTRTRSTRTSRKASARTSCRRTSNFSVIDHFEKVTDKDAADHDAAHRARGGHLRRQLRRVGDGRPAAAEGSLPRRATWSS